MPGMMAFLPATPLWGMFGMRAIILNNDGHASYDKWVMLYPSFRFHCYSTPRAEGTKSAPLGWILARVLAQHDEAATIGRIAAREGRFSAHRHLPCTRCPPQLLKAIREEDGAVAPRAVIATTG
jgi:hypothetical protein